MFSFNKSTKTNLPLVGVGLRHNLYDDALNYPANIDFIEIHAENFFAAGGITHALLEDIKKHYQISLHATSLGLGSSLPAPDSQLAKMQALAERVQPILVSDHACFSWAQLNDISVHAGDLLPIPFNDESLAVMVENVARVQNKLQRPILVENLSAYLDIEGSTYSEFEFLTKLCQQTDCKLLLDINNLVVNATNAAASESERSIKEQVNSWLKQIPVNIVGEIYLAGCTPVSDGKIMIDDHSQPVSDELWQLYRIALQRFGPVPTLIEWDLTLPTWQVLVAEAEKAKAIAEEVFHEPC